MDKIEWIRVLLHVLTAYLVLYQCKRWANAISQPVNKRCCTLRLWLNPPGQAGWRLLSVHLPQDAFIFFLRVCNCAELISVDQTAAWGMSDLLLRSRRDRGNTTWKTTSEISGQLSTSLSGRPGEHHQPLNSTASFHWSPISCRMCFGSWGEIQVWPECSKPAASAHLIQQLVG